MDLNKANQKELMRVNGIGKVLAKRIIQSQPFVSWAQVEKVVQIGDKRLAALQRSFVLEVEVEHKGDSQAADPKTEAHPKAKADLKADPKAEADPKATDPRAEADPKAIANSADSES